jgi:hypothetical protein
MPIMIAASFSPSDDSSSLSYSLDEISSDSSSFVAFGLTIRLLAAPLSGDALISSSYSSKELLCASTFLMFDL